MAEDEGKKPEEGEEKKAAEGEEIRQAMTPDDRAKLCAEEVNQVLGKWNCIFNPYAIISGAGVTAHVKVIPLLAPPPKKLVPFVNPNPEHENDPSKFN